MDLKIYIKRKLNIFCPVFMTKYYYKKNMGKKLNLRKPKSLNEKVNWLKLYYWPKKELSSTVADKYAVRKYVDKCNCSDLLNELIGVWDSTDEIPWDSLPNQFAIKCGHGCGMNIICDDKSKINKDEVYSKLNTWMKMDWGEYSCEPHYSAIKPKIICEKYLEGKDGNLVPDDIKIHCFKGKPKLIAYYSGRGKSLHGTFYDINWNHLDISTKEGALIEKPKCLDRLLEACESLASELPYARIDFYIVDSKPIFGEITLTPASGRSPYMKEEFDFKYGNYIDLKQCGYKER